MNKKLVRNIILSVAAIAVLALGYFFAVKWEPAEDSSAEPTPTAKAEIVVMALKSDDLTSMEIHNPSETYTIIRKDDGYTIRGYENADLSSSQLESVFKSLENLTATQTIQASDDLAAYGLAQPACTVTATMNDSSVHTLKIGDKTPTGDGYYCIGEDGKTVYLIASGTAERYLRKVSDYRNLSVAKVDYNSVSAFEIDENGKNKVKMRLKNDSDTLGGTSAGSWVMTAPYYCYISDEKFAKLFENLSEITAISVVEDSTANSSQYGIGKYTLRITDTDGTKTISLGNTDHDGNVYAVVDGQNRIITLSSSWLKLAADFVPFEYISKFAHIYQIDDVSKVTVQYRDTEQTLQIDRSKSDPVYMKDGKAIEEDAFKKAYQQVIGIQFTGEAGEKKAGKKIATVTFEFTDGKKSVNEYFEYDERNYLVQCSDGSRFVILKKNLDNAVSALQNDSQATEKP